MLKLCIISNIKYCGRVWLFLIIVDSGLRQKLRSRFIWSLCWLQTACDRSRVHTPVDLVRWHKPPPGGSLRPARYPSIRSDTPSIRSSRLRPAGPPRRPSSAAAARRTLSDHTTQQLQCERRDGCVCCWVCVFRCDRPSRRGRSLR